MKVQGISANDYLGIESVSDPTQLSFSFQNILSGIKNSIDTYLYFFCGWNFLNEPHLHFILSILFVLSLGIVLVVSAYKSGLLKRKLQFTLAILSLFFTIPCACMWCFATPELTYYVLMVQSFSLYYILCAILYDRWMKVKLSNLMALFLIIIVFFHTILANTAYFYLEQSYERSYATGLEITMRIHQFQREAEFEKIAVIGTRLSEVALSNPDNHSELKFDMFEDRLQTDLLFKSSLVELFISNQFGVKETFLSAEECSALAQTQEVQDMECWPSAYSMQVIDNILVIKFSNTLPA